MNPFRKTIKFKEKKPNHFYARKTEKGEFIEVKNPIEGQEIYEIPSISGGQRLLLEIPIPLCKKHFNKGKKFGVTTCNNWNYIAIPVELGSSQCRKCLDLLYIPMPFLYSANLRSADLRSANLSSADLRSADLSSADLSSANLYSANLYSANLRSANLCSADLRSANLCSADLYSANLHSADLRSANLCSADLRSANLCSADLYSANLHSADLRSANLCSADLSSADLSSADLSSADLHSADLRSADLRSAKNLDKAYWNKFTVIDKEFKKLLSKDRFCKI